MLFPALVAEAAVAAEQPFQVQVRGGVRLPLLRGEEHPCSYLPDRLASMLYWIGPAPDGLEYQQLMDRGFRRSGNLVYAAACRDCAACVPIRVPVAAFKPSKSQVRVIRRNGDVEVRLGRPVCDESRLSLFNRYQAARHAGQLTSTASEYSDFLVTGPGEPLEMTYWIGSTLIGVGILDVTPVALSSVYFYFDPDHERRSLGVLSAITEVEECRRRGLAYWYLGYFVAGCAKMRYKADYRPHEYLHQDGRWRPDHPVSQPAQYPSQPDS